MSIQISMPVITAATISPNPATINMQVAISVTVPEQTVTLVDQPFYSGEIYSGEAQ